MTRDDITRMAHEAAGFDGTTSLERPVVLYAAMSKDFLDKFAALVAAAERGACADIAENWNCNGFPRVGVAEAIRARGQA